MKFDGAHPDLLTAVELAEIHDRLHRAIACTQEWRSLSLKIARHVQAVKVLRKKKRN
jgi:hypothetical protein